MLICNRDLLFGLVVDYSENTNGNEVNPTNYQRFPNGSEGISTPAQPYTPYSYPAPKSRFATPNDFADYPCNSFPQEANHKNTANVVPIKELDLPDDELERIYYISSRYITSIWQRPDHYTNSLKHALEQHGEEAIAMIGCLCQDFEEGLRPYKLGEEDNVIDYWLSNPEGKWDGKRIRFCITGKIREQEMGEIEQSLFRFKTTEYDRQYFDTPIVEASTVIHTPADLILALSYLNWNPKIIYTPNDPNEILLSDITDRINDQYGTTAEKILFAYNDLLNNGTLDGFDFSKDEIDAMYYYLLVRHGLKGYEERSLTPPLRVWWKPKVIVGLTMNTKVGKGDKRAFFRYENVHMVTAYRHRINGHNNS